MSRRGSQAGLDAPVRCYYAAEPARRPRCTLAAEVMAGPIPLCGSCAAARSTLGKAGPLVPLPPGPPPDVLAWISQAHAAVGNANGTWPRPSPEHAPAGTAGPRSHASPASTRQAAQQRFGHQPPPRPVPSARDCP